MLNLQFLRFSQSLNDDEVKCKASNFKWHKKNSDKGKVHVHKCFKWPR